MKKVWLLTVTAVVVVAAGAAVFSQNSTLIAPSQPVLLAAGDKADEGLTQADIPVSRVVLFSSGVGYFEHAGSVEGEAVTKLMFKTEQINDVLKSMVVMDLDKGVVRRVGYGSREPLERALKSFGVDISGEPTLGELLAQLRGADVIVLAPEKLAGKVFNVEQRTKVIGQPPAQITEEILDLVTPEGIKQIPLTTVASVRLADEKLDSELNKALALLVASRDKDRKPVEVQFSGQGKRRVRIGYIAETPVWKTSYRLDLTGDKPLMQGWAIVENTSDNDWATVNLTLVSGRPISFVQDLYTPLYVPRPVVVPELYASLRPQMYDEGLAKEAKVRQLAAAPPAPAGAEMARRKADARRPSEEEDRAEVATAVPGVAYAGRLGAGEGGRFDPVSLAQGVQSVAQAAKIGELFQYTISEPVNLARRRSAMLPVINAPIKAEKVSIYNPATLPKNPLNGVILTNDTGMKMLGGPVTVLDDGMYAGDARLDNLSPGDKRLLSYAVDLSVTVDPSGSSSSAVTAVKVVRGVLTISRKHTYKQEYLINNKADKARTLIIEQPFVASRTLVDPKTYEEKTAAIYRFRVPVDKETTGKFTVVEEQPDSQTVAILPANPDSLLVYTTSKDISQPIKDALAKAITMKQEMAQLQARLNQIQQQLDAIKNGQARLRENLKAVAPESQLAKTYLAKLAKEEDDIDKLEAQAKELRDQIQAKQKQLEDYLAGLNIE